VVTVGRHPGARLRTADLRVSRRHLELRPGPEGWTLVDLDSTNGTFQEGRRVRSLPVTGELAVLLGDAQDGPRLEVEPVGPTGPPALRVTAGGRTLTADGSDVVSIGRDPTNSLVVDDPRVSRFHLEVRLSVGTWCVEDVGSVNGTFVDGQRVEDEVAIERPTRLLLADAEHGLSVDLEPL
jgi:pSer/pThr/pTyr-binding forkhead associated (FHA) protein